MSDDSTSACHECRVDNGDHAVGCNVFFAALTKASKPPFPADVFRELLPVVAKMSDGQISPDVRTRINTEIAAPSDDMGLWSLCVEIGRMPETEVSRFVSTTLAADRFYVPPT